MKKPTPIVAIAVVALMTLPVLAQPPEKRNRENQRGDRKTALQRDGKGPMRPQVRNGAGPGQRQQMDPARMAERMMEEFDRNSDGQLNAKELTALLTALRDRRGMAAGQAGRPAVGGQLRDRRPMNAEGKPGNQRAEGKGRQRRGSDLDAAEVGGDKPNRPRKRDNEDK